MPRYYSPAEQRELAGDLAPVMDGLSTSLRQRGYAPTGVYAARLGVIHLGAWCRRRTIKIGEFDDSVVDRFVSHLRRCRCGLRRPIREYHRRRDAWAARQVLAYLRARDIARPALEVSWPPLIEGFLASLRDRGLSEQTTKGYLRASMRLLADLGEDPAAYRATDLRNFITRQSHLRNLHVATTRGLVGALRSFLRYLVVNGRCASTLVDGLPKVAHWRLAGVPQYITPAAVEQAIAAPNTDTAVGIRDRAVLLLLARLGLRAGEVARLRLSDLDSQNRRIRIVGSKTGQVAWLPMPTDVARAVDRYLSKGRPATEDDRVFVRARAPFVGGNRAGMITHVVVKALRGAAVRTPIAGARVFRHSVATNLLRTGWTLDAIGALLRHRHPETTAIYAKVDFGTLRLVTQPWPEKIKTQ